MGVRSNILRKQILQAANSYLKNVRENFVQSETASPLFF